MSRAQSPRVSPAVSRDSDSLRIVDVQSAPALKAAYLSLSLIYLKIIKSFSTSPHIIDSFQTVLRLLMFYIVSM